VCVHKEEPRYARPRSTEHTGWCAAPLFLWVRRGDHRCAIPHTPMLCRTPSLCTKGVHTAACRQLPMPHMAWHMVLVPRCLLARCLNVSACDRELGQAAVVCLRLDLSGCPDDAADGGLPTLVSFWGRGCSGAGNAAGQCQLARNTKGMARLHSEEYADRAKPMVPVPLQVGCMRVPASSSGLLA
jgi:hypothetical protein